MDSSSSVYRSAFEFRALSASAGPTDNERPIVRIAIRRRRYDRAVEIAASSPSTISGNCRRVKLVIKLLL